MASIRLLQLNTRTAALLLNHSPRCNVVNVPPTATGKRRFRKEVETDPHKLVNYCCGLNYVQDDPPVKLKPDEEYPDWLWTLRLGPKPNSWELEEGTKEYYLQLAQEEKDRNYLRRLRAGGTKKVVGKVLKAREHYLHFKRFAALAHLEDDAGLELHSTEIDWIKGQRISIKRSDYYLPYNEERVLYMDEIKGNSYVKNYHYDDESTFKTGQRMKPPRSNKLEPFQDSKRRHRYACN